MEDYLNQFKIILTKPIRRITPTTLPFDLNKELNPESIVEELESRIVSILKLRIISEPIRKRLIEYLTQLNKYFDISIDYIRFLLLYEHYNNYKQTVENIRSNYGRSKVTHLVKRFKSILKTEGIETERITKESKKRKFYQLGVAHWTETYELEFLKL